MPHSLLRMPFEKKTMDSENDWTRSFCQRNYVVVSKNESSSLEKLNR